jgi:hypothetical protein
LPFFGAKVQKRAQYEHAREEEKYHEIHEAPFKGTGNEPTLLEVKVQQPGNDQ